MNSYIQNLEVTFQRVTKLEIQMANQKNHELILPFSNFSPLNQQLFLLSNEIVRVKYLLYFKLVICFLFSGEKKTFVQTFFFVATQLFTESNGFVLLLNFSTKVHKLGFLGWQKEKYSFIKKHEYQESETWVKKSRFMRNSCSKNGYFSLERPCTSLTRQRNKKKLGGIHEIRWQDGGTGNVDGI